MRIKKAVTLAVTTSLLTSIVVLSDLNVNASFAKEKMDKFLKRTIMKKIMKLSLLIPKTMELIMKT